MNTVKQINKFIDHTQLKPEATAQDITKLCDEAIEYDLKAVCVNPSYVKLTKEKLAHYEEIKVASVVGFPLGTTTTATKVYEATEAIKNGADEIDMVLNIGFLKDWKDKDVEEDIREVVRAVRAETIVKVILETCLLTKEEKIKACNLAKNAGAHFVKTSTGFSSGGATADDIKLMRSVVGDALGVKASGGIKDYKTAKLMIDSGATRIGASKSISIVKGD